MRIGCAEPGVILKCRHEDNAGSVNPTVGDFAGNSARILILAAQAQQRGADLAVFSELCFCGHLPQDLLERPAFIDRNHKELKQLAAQLPLPTVVECVVARHKINQPFQPKHR